MNATQPGTEPSPLWDTGRIRAYVDQHYKDYGTRWSAMYHGARMMADEMQAKLAHQAARIDELERQLSICSEYADKVRGEKGELAEQYYRLRAGLPEKDGAE